MQPANRTVDKNSLWPSNGPCALCGTTGPLCRSHIIPKFVGDWLRGTNVTGRLRSNKAPNRLVEDLEWRYLLCAKCEGRFSVFELEVCENIFLPIHEGKNDRFRYGPSFLRFAVSVVWRALVVMRREGGLGVFSEAQAEVDAAERVWRDFLLNNRGTPAPHVVHALPLDVPMNLDPHGKSPHYSRFLLRMPAIGMRYMDRAGYVIVKMGRLIVFGVVGPGNERRQWQATQLHAEGGSWGVEDYHVPGWVAAYLDLGAKKLQECAEALSLKQKHQTKEKLKEAIYDDVDRVASSDIFRAFEEDLKIFGSDVFQQSLTDDDGD